MPRINSDVASERFILIALANNGSTALNEINDIIDDKCFFDTLNKEIFLIFKYALSLHDKIDIVTFLSSAKDCNLSYIVDTNTNTKYIHSIFNTKVIDFNLRKIALKLKKIRVTYDIQLELENIHTKLNSVTGNEKIDEILSIVEEPIYNIDRTTHVDLSKPQQMFDNVDEYLNFLATNECEYVGIPTKYKYYDFMIGGGLRPGYMNLIVARPKSGKSVFAFNVGYNIACDNIPVLILDTEMDKELQQARAISALTNTEPNLIETGKFNKLPKKSLIYQTMNSVKNIPLYYQRIAGKEFDEVLSIIRRWVKQEVGVDENGNTKKCVVIYDYFKLMSTNDLAGLAEHQALGFQLSKFTDFLGNNKVACLAFVQANREGITKETTDILSQSDRLTWLCSSLALLRKKTVEEMANEGLNKGDRKLIPMEGMRFSEGLADGDWVNLRMSNFRIYELGTHQHPDV